MDRLSRGFSLLQSPLQPLLKPLLHAGLHESIVARQICVALLQALLQAVLQGVLQAVLKALLQGVLQAVLQAVLQGVLQAVLQALLQALWAGNKFPKTGNRGRLCMRCAPKTAESGQRYCQQCDRAKPTGDFGQSQGGKVPRACRSCSTQQARLSFFANGTPPE